MTKKTSIFLSVTILSILVFNVVFAQESTPTPTATPSVTPSPTPTLTPTPTPTTTSTITPTPSIIPNIKNISEKDLKQSLSINEIKGRIICRLVGGCPNVENKGEVEVLIKAAQVTAVGSNEISIKIFGIEYKVNLSKAKILKSQWISGDVDDFVVGDIVNVYGFITEEAPLIIYAQTVRNLSLQKHLTIFKGLIQNLGNFSFSLLTEQNELINVAVTNDTRIIKTEGVACIQIYPPINCPMSTSTTITFADLKNGDKVIVRGEYDKVANQLTAEQILVGNDGRPFFKKELKIQNQQKDNSLREEIKNQIKNLQDRIKELKEQMKMQLF
ncbi:MAG: hypothetical protein N2692_02340 [Patescibacteria group bacterium]|jgi:hypothetical protein|nr:hypothetical protein [Patescibacteria group bacterium]